MSAESTFAKMMEISGKITLFGSGKSRCEILINTVVSEDFGDAFYENYKNQYQKALRLSLFLVVFSQRCGSLLSP